MPPGQNHSRLQTKIADDTLGQFRFLVQIHDTTIYIRNKISINVAMKEIKSKCVNILQDLHLRYLQNSTKTYLLLLTAESKLLFVRTNTPSSSAISSANTLKTRHKQKTLRNIIASDVNLGRDPTISTVFCINVA